MEKEKNLQTTSPWQTNSAMIPTTFARSITIPVELYKAKNGRILKTGALIDSGETISCIDHHLVNRMKWPLEKLPRPHGHARNMDRTENVSGTI